MLSPVPCPPLVSPLKCPGGDRRGVPRPQPGGRGLCLGLGKGPSSVLLSPPPPSGPPLPSGFSIVQNASLPFRPALRGLPGQSRMPWPPGASGASTDPGNASCLDHPLHRANGPPTIFLQGSRPPRPGKPPLPHQPGASCQPTPPLLHLPRLCRGKEGLSL